MSKELKPAIFVFILAVASLLLLAYFHSNNVTIFNPQGTIAHQERNLIVTAVFLMFVVLLPMLFTGYFFAWKYRAGNKKAKYDPEAGQHLKGGILWAIIPALVILGLGTVVWVGAHNLDPYKPIRSDTKPINVQVVALNWKWLFIYPDRGIATVNFLEIPEQTPVNFQLTADAPMNSFWIPSLGGQIYAMSGMSTQLHLEADSVGEYRGQAAEINGPGYSGMKFTTKSVTQTDFDNWVESVKKSSPPLSLDEYIKLSSPSQNNPVSLYSSYEPDLYNKIIMKYMRPNPEVIPDMHK